MRRFTEDQVLASVERVSVRRLRTWVRRGWIRPETDADRWIYSEADVARICLFCELREDLSIDEEALSLIVPLIDQIHGLRRELRNLGRAVESPSPSPSRTRSSRRSRRCRTSERGYSAATLAGWTSAR
jgi:chaperone modulatory protein CbpM